jgi:predicted ATPase
MAGELVGRQAETAVLDALLTEAEQGLPSVVLVTGEAG